MEKIAIVGKGRQRKLPSEIVKYVTETKIEPVKLDNKRISQDKVYEMFSKIDPNRQKNKNEILSNEEEELQR